MKGRVAREEALNQFEKMIDDLEADDLAIWYSEFEKSQEGLSTMEICNSTEDCNNYVIKKLKEDLKSKFRSQQNERFTNRRDKCNPKQEGSLPLGSAGNTQNHKEQTAMNVMKGGT